MASGHLMRRQAAQLGASFPGLRHAGRLASDLRWDKHVYSEAVGLCWRGQWLIPKRFHIDWLHVISNSDQYLAPGIAAIVDQNRLAEAVIASNRSRSRAIPYDNDLYTVGRLVNL